MKRVYVQALTAGGYRLWIAADDGTKSRWRSDTEAIPTSEEALRRADVVARTLGYRLDRRVRQPGARPSPPPREDDMGGTGKSSDVLEKGTAVKIVTAGLKDKRREQLEGVLRKTGHVIRYLNGRYYVAFEGGDTKWWLAADQVKAVEAKTDEPEAEADKPANPNPMKQGKKSAKAKETAKEAGAESTEATTPVAV